MELHKAGQIWATHEDPRRWKNTSQNQAIRKKEGNWRKKTSERIVCTAVEGKVPSKDRPQTQRVGWKAISKRKIKI